MFCSNLHSSTVILGSAHGSYGIGGKTLLTTLWIDITFFPLLILVPNIDIIGLITATAMVSHGVLWSRFYFITLGLRLFCIASAGWAFWSYEEGAPTGLLTALERIASRRKAIEVGEPSKTQLMKQALKSRVTLVGALFILHIKAPKFPFRVGSSHSSSTTVTVMLLQVSGWVYCKKSGCQKLIL